MISTGFPRPTATFYVEVKFVSWETSCELGNNSAVLYHRDLRSSPPRTHKVQEDFVCWTKMQAEAGQPIETIVARKELERQAGDGMFMWGVGNAPALLINTLARLEQRVPVVFSLMKTKPKAVDLAPSGTLGALVDTDSSKLMSDLRAAGISKAAIDAACRRPQQLGVISSWSWQAIASRWVTSYGSVSLNATSHP